MATMRAGRYSLWLGIAAVVTGLDQLTKHLASTNLDLYRPAEITSWFNLTLAHNTGAAFSFLAGGTGWQRWFLALVAAIISISLLIWLWRLPQRARILPSAIALVLGGAIGNLIDRIRFGYVVDFIDVHYAGWHWPAFNLADSAIVTGVILLLLDALIPRRSRLN